MAARVQLRPAQPRAGETVEVRIIIGHPMENGLRRGASGDRITRNVIPELVCRYGGQEVMRISLGTGISANPYVSFLIRAAASGELRFDWIDEQGVRDSQSIVMDVI